MIRAGPNGLVLGASIACPFGRVGSSTLRARSPRVIVAKSRRGSYQPPIPRPTQVGGVGRARAVPSPREADATPSAQVRVRRPRGAPADRSDARSTGRTKLPGRAAEHALVRPSGDRGAGAPDRRAPV